MNQKRIHLMRRRKVKKSVPNFAPGVSNYSINKHDHDLEYFFSYRVICQEGVPNPATLF